MSCPRHRRCLCRAVPSNPDISRVSFRYVCKLIIKPRYENPLLWFLRLWFLLNEEGRWMPSPIDKEAKFFRRTKELLLFIIAKVNSRRRRKTSQSPRLSPPDLLPVRIEVKNSFILQNDSIFRRNKGMSNLRILISTPAHTHLRNASRRSLTFHGLPYISEKPCDTYSYDISRAQC